MGFEGAPKAPALKIETIRSKVGMATFAPERGGIVTSLKLHGREVLYMDPSTLMDPSKNVRGGIPILFPQAGPVENRLYPNLPQHGFARNLKWDRIINPEKNSFTESTGSNGETLKQYPYKFILEVQGLLTEHSFAISQAVTNLEQGKEMPFAMGLHPYFPVSIEDKERIRFAFAGGEELEKRKGEWMAGEAVIIDNPKRSALNADMPVQIPGLGGLVLEASPQYQKIAVWSEPQKPFVCIEPWMRGPEGLVEDPEYLLPHKRFQANFSITLEH